MATYRINFIATYTVDIEAEDDIEARKRAASMEFLGRFAARVPKSQRWQHAWNTITRVDGAND